MTFARKVGLIGRAPYIERPAKPTPKERWLTHAEIQRLRESAGAPHILLAIDLLLSTAGRAGAGLEGVTLHVLRHTAAVHLVQAGVSIDQVAQYLGHSNTAITYSTYARYSPDHLRDAAEVLDFASLRRNRFQVQ